MRGFFGVWGPKRALTEIVNRYNTFKSTLNDTLFSEEGEVGSGEWGVEGTEVYLSQWLHTGNNPDVESRQIFELLHVVGWATLYESAELKSKLGLEGEYTSLELIQFAWNRWGTDALQHLEGDFSFVVWDKRLQKLYLVKDQIGVRPLFYAQVYGCLVFGSTIPVLKAAFGSDLKLNRLAVAHELKNYPPTVEMTMFEGLHRLKPAHFIEVSVNDAPIVDLVEQRYWDLEPINVSEYTHDELIDMVRQEMTSAIQRRIEGVKTVACQLSGGLDSSVIGVVLSKLMDKHDLHTFSFVLSEKTREYSERGIDEQWSQDLVREFAGLLPENHHHITEFHYKDVFDEMETNIRVMGGPANSDTIWQDTLFKNAAEYGAQVSFSGFPGDEGISTPGGNYYYDFVKYRQLGGILGHLWHFHIRGIKHFYSYWKHSKLGTTKPDYAAIQETRNLLRKDAPEFDQIQDLSFAFNPGFKSGFKEKILRWHTTLRTESEGAYANQYGIETRYPLVDIRLIQLVYSLPVEMFRPKPYTRALFRSVCKDLLPDKVRLQPKFSGALTLAFAEYWIKTSTEQLDQYQIKDPLSMYLTFDEIDSKVGKNEILSSKESKIAQLKKIDFLICNSLREPQIKKS